MNCCEREDEILDAIHSGLWSPEQRVHVEQCAACRELVVTTTALLEPLPATLPSPPSLPSANFLWWKAQLAARRHAAARSERPLVIAEWAGLAGALGVAGLLANWMLAAAVLVVAVPVAWYGLRSHQSE